MSKPNSPKCKTCAVINNKLRCGTCKFKTKEWAFENFSPVMIFGDSDNYKEKDLSKIKEEQNKNGDD